MNTVIRYILIGFVFVAALTIWDGFFILPEGKQAVVTQFGAPVGDPATKAGLHFKTPFIQEVRFFEKRVMIWDGDPNQIPTSDKTFVYIDDIQVGSPWSFRFQSVRNENCETARQQIIDINHDFLLIGGDLIRDGSIHKWGLENIIADLDSLLFPYHVISGNKDTCKNTPI